MPVRRSSAFTFMELMIMVGVIGMMIPIILRFMPKPALYEWEGIKPELNALAIFARQQAIITQKLHRLLIKHDPKKVDVIVLERYDEDEKENLSFVPVVPPSFSRYTLPRGCHITDLRRNNKDELGKEKREVALLISPDGIFDTATIEITREVDNDRAQMKLSIEPFIGQFKRVVDEE